MTPTTALALFLGLFLLTGGVVLFASTMHPGLAFIAGFGWHIVWKRVETWAEWVTE